MTEFSLPQAGEFLGPSAAGRLCDVAASTIVSWERKGILPALRTTDGHRIFRRSDVLRVKERRAKRQEAREATE